ncbi:MAG: hypothetical protein EON93_25760 [Burkholderiales bacterium]|nr:MAG: hypothetical protein EON93_25760 [Burkholderiales bacterium]
MRLWPESRERQVLMYDKHHYFWDGMTKHRQTLLGQLPVRSWERLGPALNFDRMMDEHLNQGIRIETRHQRNLKTHGLTVGSAWTLASARHLHHRVLSDVILADLPPISEAETLLASVGEDDRRLIALWLSGRRVSRFFDAPATYDRCRKRILAQHDINFSRTPIPCEQAQWSFLIAPESVLETPAWALEGPLLHDPSHVAQGLVVPPGRDAWPPPAKTKKSTHVPTANVVPARARRRR